MSVFGGNAGGDVTRKRKLLDKQNNALGSERFWE
jgi:translation elongation factor EF-4